MNYWSKLRQLVSETMEVVAIGRALERRQITAAQASAAIGRVGQRDKVDVGVRETDRDSDRELVSSSSSA